MKHSERVRAVLDHFEVTLSHADAVTRWVDLVDTWNQRMDLTAARNDDELVDLMVADAAKLASRLEGDRVVDVGCGPGAPGLPIALLRRDIHMTLVEPLQKRTTVLRMCKGTEKDATFTVVQGRGEDVAERFDVAISRATLPPPKWLALGSRLAPVVWVLLAAHDPPTLDGWAITHDERYTWPLTTAERRIVRYEPDG